MPYIEMAKSPKIQNIIEALKYKTDGGNISREYGGGGVEVLWNIRKENSAKLNRTIESINNPRIIVFKTK